jgi:hypothetical protein
MTVRIRISFKKLLSVTLFFSKVYESEDIPSYMLDRAIFSKHTRLFLFMMSRVNFSQKEIIAWSLENKEFKDKDSWENRGQFRDKMISLGLLSKHSYKEFASLHPDLAAEAASAYEGSHERKRIILSFQSLRLLEIRLPALRSYAEKSGDHKSMLDLIPLKAYSAACLEMDQEPLGRCIDAFIVGCSMQRVLLLMNQRLHDVVKIFVSGAKGYVEIDIDGMQDHVLLARDLFEKNIRSHLEKRT